MILRFMARRLKKRSVSMDLAGSVSIMNRRKGGNMHYHHSLFKIQQWNHQHKCQNLFKPVMESAKVCQNVYKIVMESAKCISEPF